MSADYTPAEIAKAFGLLAETWALACSAEIVQLRKLQTSSDTVGDTARNKIELQIQTLRGKADAYSRIAQVADETVTGLQGGTITPNPTAAKGA